MKDEFRVQPMRVDDQAPLLRLWERSVRATHHFLSPDDITELVPHVAAALASDALDWWVVVTTAGDYVGFLGFVDPRVEALFIDPDHFGRGGGRLLVAHAETLGSAPLEVDVNEGNDGAVRFYERLGFRVIGRSPLDSAGRPFPLLHMRRTDPDR
jgi:putative acetyltransferase